jgi:hypothetical protein
LHRLYPIKGSSPHLSDTSDTFLNKASSHSVFFLCPPRYWGFDVSPPGEGHRYNRLNLLMNISDDALKHGRITG